MQELSEKRRRYWQQNLRLTTSLLAVWFAVTFGTSWFARDLTHIVFLNFPLSFWIAAQGALIVYVVLIRIYANRMNALDETFGVAEEMP